MYIKTSFTSNDSPVATTAGVSFLVSKLARIHILDEAETLFLTLKNLGAQDNTVHIGMGSKLAGETIKISITLTPNEVLQVPVPTGNNKDLSISCSRDLILADMEHIRSYTDDPMFQPFHPNYSLGCGRSYSHLGYMLNMGAGSYVQLLPSKVCEIAKVGVIGNRLVDVTFGRFKYSVVGYCNFLLPYDFVTGITIAAKETTTLRMTLTGQRQSVSTSHMQEWRI